MDKLNELFNRACDLSDKGKKCPTDLAEMVLVRDEFWKLQKRSEAAEAHVLSLNQQMGCLEQKGIEDRKGRLMAEERLAELANQEPVGYTYNRGVNCEIVAADLNDECPCNVDLFTRAAPAAVPDGWKMVPLQPTDEMIQAWRNDMSNSYASQYAENIGEDEIVFAHQAMLAVAPEPPAC